MTVLLPANTTGTISVGEQRIIGMMSEVRSDDKVEEDVTRLLAPRADCTGLPNVDVAAVSGR